MCVCVCVFPGARHSDPHMAHFGVGGWVVGWWYRCHIGNLGVSCVYFGDHITTEYNMYYSTYCIFFSLFLARAR